MKRTLLIAALLLLGTAACERRSWAVYGQLALAPAVGADAVPARVEGATATLRCEGEKAAASVRLDAAGAFELSGPGLGPRFDCTLEVVAPGLGRWSSRVADVCLDDDDDDRCEHAVVLAHIVSPQAQAQLDGDD